MGDKVDGALIRFDEKGQVVKHSKLPFERGYCYISIDRSQNYLMGVQYRGGQAEVYRLNDSKGKILRWLLR